MRASLWNIYEKYAHNVYSEQLETKVIFLVRKMGGSVHRQTPLVAWLGILTRGPPAIDASCSHTLGWTVRSKLEGRNNGWYFYQQFFARFGTPKSLVYDMQSSMMGELFQSVLRRQGIDSVIALAGYHITTAHAERQIRTVEQILKAIFMTFRRHGIQCWIILLSIWTNNHVVL